MNIKRQEQLGEYEDRFVAFIDILGFKSLIEQSISDENIRKKVYNSLRVIDEEVQFNYDESIIPREPGREYTAFSDSLVISYKAGTYVDGGLYWILSDLTRITQNLIQRGIFVRGGITFGKLYHDERICYGPAMVHAYQIEESAIYPRIIIDKDILDKALQHRGYANTVEEEIQYLSPFMEIDTDDKDLYLDFLSQSNDISDYNKFLKTVKEVVTRELSKDYEAKIKAKYIWFGKYYNRCINGLVNRKDDWLIGEKYFLDDVCSET